MSLDFLQTTFRTLHEDLVRIEDLLNRILDNQVVQQQKTDIFQNILLSAINQAVPYSTRGVTVPTNVVPLATNDGANVQNYVISNLDPAQPCWVGLENVTVTNGRIINPQDSIVMTLPKGTAVYGICQVGTIQVVVSQLRDLLSEMRKIFDIGGVV